VKHVGGLHVLIERLSTPHLAPDGKHLIHYLNVLPDFTNNWDLALAVFIMPLAVQWWATWYPGSEPGGGSYIAQRMLASKSEKDALGAVLFFNVAHYVLRPWPWILVGLCSLLVYPELSDIQAAFPKLDPKLLGHDIAYPAMLRFLPVGFIGLIVGGLIAANSSTILTHLNWGASYLVHDFYRRFLNAGASEKHYVWIGRLNTLVLFLCAAALTMVLETAKDTFDLILQVGAGTGLLYLVRWFWWRVNAWCEVVAMASSFAVSVGFLILHKNHIDFTSQSAMLITIAITTFCWILTAFLAPQTAPETLVSFFCKVKPFGPGWRHVREIAAASSTETAISGENMPLALLGWLAGSTLIWSGLFTVGNFLYGRLLAASGLLLLFIVSLFILLFVMKRSWTNGKQPAQPERKTASLVDGAGIPHRSIRSLLRTESRALWFGGSIPRHPRRLSSLLRH
ncbi:MAG TPA: Na+:solute symporter, partial [Candidatus Dormibacteraeota bacterium]|nr:Na+:solute symporter [Candidatus Dormibacteraeota bacterium]